MAIDVDALKSATDLVAVVGSITPLSKRGTEYVGRCVAHSPDDHPSMYVNPRKGIVHCFSCGFSTDLIGFVMHTQGLDFKAACEWLGAKPSLSPSLSAPPRRVVPDRITSKPPADAESPNMLIRSMGPPTRIWPYRDADGSILGYVARYDTEDGKEIRCWTWGRVGDAEPGWACGHWNAPRYLYGLDRLAARPDDKVVVTEGEKAADAAGRLLPGYVAVSWPGGCHAVHKADWSPLRGRNVLLWPDADEPGWKAMQTLAEILHTLGCAVRILDPLQAPAGWDAADAEDEGWNTARLIEWAKPRASDWRPPAMPQDALGSPTSSAEPTPTADTPSQAPAKPAPVRLAAVDGLRVSDEPGEDALPMSLSESGIALEFVSTRCQDMRYVCEWDKWLVWSGGRWKVESRRQTAMQRLQTLAYSLKYRPEARELPVSSKQKLERKQFLSAVLDLAEFDRRLIVAPDEFDTDPFLLGTPGGTVDLREGKLIEPSITDMITRQTTVTPAAGPHPLWDQVMRCASGGDPEVERYVWRWLGYCLSGSVREEAFLFLHGLPASGKSTLVEAVAAILGNVHTGGYAVKARIELFLESKHDRPGDLHILHGARFAHASETEEGRHWKAALLKETTGGDTLIGEKKYQDIFSFRPSHKLIVAGNHRPHLRNADDGVKRRMHLLEYHGNIAEADRDTEFKSKLVAEYPAILHSMIQGCLAWQLSGLRKPASIAASIESYFDAEDSIGVWIDEELERGSAYFTPVGEAYQAFSRYIEKQGESVPSKKRFSTMMQARGFEPERKGGIRCLTGFRLKVEIPPDRWSDGDRY